MKPETTPRRCATTSRLRLVPRASNCASSTAFTLPTPQLGRTDEAEKAFAKIVALGLATNSLSVKFLFRPGSLEFLRRSESRAAPTTCGCAWLRAKSRRRRACLTIVGHTSRTGAEQFNDRLSMQRAVAIQRRLEVLAPDYQRASYRSGMGFRENLVGSGTDDLRDALDRRVEFKVRNC